jgi:hypothetical protein
MDEFGGFDGDPLSLHKYLYANADPVNHIDPSGYSTIGDYARLVVAISINVLRRYLPVIARFIICVFLTVASVLSDNPYLAGAADIAGMFFCGARRGPRGGGPRAGGGPRGGGGPRAGGPGRGGSRGGGPNRGGPPQPGGRNYRGRKDGAEPKPPDMQRPQVHHDMPQKFRDRFEREGIDIDHPDNTRWVEGDPHNRWSREFNREWENFFNENPNATRDQILDFMNRMRNDPRFPSR